MTDEGRPHLGQTFEKWWERYDGGSLYSSHALVARAAWDAGRAPLLGALAEIAYDAELYGRRHYGGGVAAKVVFDLGHKAEQTVLAARGEAQEDE